MTNNDYTSDFDTSSPSEFPPSFSPSLPQANQESSLPQASQQAPLQAGQGASYYHQPAQHASSFQGAASEQMQSQYRQQQAYQQQAYQQQAYQQQAQQQDYAYAQQAHSNAASQAQFPALAPQKKVGKGTTLLFGLIGVIVGAALSVGALHVATSGFTFSGVVDTSDIIITPPQEDSELAVAVAAKVTPSVVNIDVYASQDNFTLEDFFGEGSTDESDSNSALKEQTGLGSGIVLTSDGYILTNYHVVEGGEKFMVSLDNEELEATMVGADPSSDLAVIKVDATGLTPIVIGDSSGITVGAWVMAVGSPFGLEKSVSTGIVSALYRSTAMQSTSGITIYANLIQTDAAINPGNSGGALVNSSGELVGINTLINSTSGSSSGVGFAVPSNFAFDIAEQIMKGGAVNHPFLGVTLYSVDPSVAQELDLSVQSGAYIESVQPESPAEQAGLKKGDVITSIDNKNINTSAELIIEIRGYEIGKTVTLGINRGGKTEKVNVVLGSTTA